MRFFGSRIGRLSFLEEVQATADFLNLTTLERGKCTVFAIIGRIVVFSLVVLLSFFLAAVMCLKNLMNIYNEKTFSTSLYISLTYLVTWFITAYVLVDFTCSMTKLRQVVWIVTKVDLFLWQTVEHRKNVLSHYRTTMVFKYLALLAMTGFLLLINVAYYHSPHVLTVIVGVSLFVLSALGDMCIRKFTVMVHFIERRFKVLEDLLRKIWIPKNRDWQQDVKTLIQAHDLLCDSCALLNSTWRRMLVALVGTIFVSLVRSSVTLSVNIKNYGFDLLTTCELSYVLIYWLWNLYDITHYTQQCETQVQEFNSTLFCCAMSTTQIRNAELDFVNTLLVHLGKKRKVVFTGHGLFPINHTLVHSILAGVFTTVIIILQTN